jgi:PilZ domain-containing protein
MIQRSNQRRVERLAVPRHFRGPGRGGRAVHLLDLSPAGARIEHGEPVPDWSDYPMDLPPALGGGWVRGEVVWSRVSGYKPVVEGKSRLVYQTGLAFTHRTPEEHAALIGALVRIAGEWALGMLRDLRRQAEDDSAHQERFNALCGETLVWLRREIEALWFAKSQ